MYAHLIRSTMPVHKPLPQEPLSSSPNDRQHLYRRRTENIHRFLDNQTLAEHVCLWYWNCFYWKRNTLYTTKVYKHPNETTGFLKCQSAHAHSVNTFPFACAQCRRSSIFPGICTSDESDSHLDDEGHVDRGGVESGALMEGGRAARTLMEGARVESMLVAR